MSKPIFDIVVIAKNESQTLPRLVSSVKEFMDRGGNFWVLDTGSTDSTIEVAKNLGCKVEAVGDKFRIKIDKKLADKINKKFVVKGEAPVVNIGESLFDFASARNYIAGFANNDFIFTPDCDEVFTKFDINKIEECIKNGVEQLEYNFVFSHDSLGNPVIKFMHCKAYDRRKLKWQNIIHEILVGNANKQFLGEEFVYLEHYQNEKTNRTGYLKGLAVDCYNNPENDRNSHYFAREMMYNGRFKSAIKEFENHISMGRWPTESAQSMLYIGDCFKALGDFDEMFKWYSKSIDKEVRREPLMRLAEYYFFKNMYTQVIAYCEAALTVTQLPFYSNFQPYYENIPHELLYISYWWAGNKEKSKEHWEKAISYCPTNPKYVFDGKFYRQQIIDKISVVMPFKNKIKMTEECIASLIANTPNLGEIILVDDHSEEKWTMTHPLIKYHLNKGTMVTGAWNYGASLAKYNYICWCNNDLLFSPNWEIPLIKALDNDTWLVSPYHTAGIKVPEDFPVGKDRKTNMGGNKTGLSFLGSCFMMERKNWIKVGPIDERLKLWSGDNYIYESTIYDFGRQVKEIKESYIHHFVSQTINRTEANEVTKKDMDMFDKIYAERNWGKRSKHPELSWTTPEIDLRLKLPIKDITKMRVLNIGVGDCWSGLAKQLRNIKFKSLHMVDVYQPYLDEAMKMEWMAEEITFELKDGKAKYNWKDYDLVMIFDVLEHIEKEESIRIVNEIQQAGVKLLVFGPLENEPRHNSFGVASQDHISFWTQEDFNRLGLTTELLPDFHHEDGKTFPAIWAYNYSDDFYPKISFVLPTMGTRPEGLKRCLDSINNLNYPKDKIETIIKYDDINNRIGVPKLLKKGIEESTGEWVVFASDDTELTPQVIIEALKIGKDGFVAFNTGELLPDGGNRCEHFIIRKDVIAKIGEVFDCRYFHTAVDNLLSAKMDKLGIFVRAEKAIVNHYHFSKGATMDETYKIGWNEECVKHDRALLKEDLEKLNA